MPNNPSPSSIQRQNDYCDDNIDRLFEDQDDSFDEQKSSQSQSTNNSEAMSCCGSGDLQLEDKAGMLLGMFPTLSLLQIKYLLELAKGNTNVVSDLSRQWRKLVPPFLSTSHCKFYGTRLCAHT